MSGVVDILAGSRMVGGHLVSNEILNVIEAIRDYSPELEVTWIPPSKRQKGDAAFAIKHNPPGQPPYVMFYVKHEDEFDRRVLHRIIYNDQRNGEKTWDEFTAWEKANELVEKQKFLDELEMANDIAKHILQSPKNRYVVSKDLVIKDGIPFNAKGM